MALDWFPICYFHHIWFREQFKFNGTCSYVIWLFVHDFYWLFRFSTGVSSQCLFASPPSFLDYSFLSGLCLVVSPSPDCIKRCLFSHVLSDVIVLLQMFRINHSWFWCSSVGPLIPKYRNSTPTEDRLGALYCILVARLLVTCSWSQTAFVCPKF